MFTRQYDCDSGDSRGVPAAPHLPAQCWRASCRPAPLLLLAAARLRKLMTALLIKVTDGGWAAGLLGAQCQANYNGSMSLPRLCF